jgi:hypothetical protein
MSNMSETPVTSGSGDPPAAEESNWKVFGGWLRGTLRGWLGYIFLVALLDAIVTGGVSSLGRPTAFAAFAINLAPAAVLAAVVNRKLLSVQMLTAATIVAYASASAAGTVYAWLDPEASEGALPFALALAPSVLLLIVRLKRRS